MKRYKTLLTVLLTIFTLAFFVFVIMMQEKFNNPEFADVPALQTANSTNKTDDKEDEETGSEDAVAGAAGSVVNDENASEDEDNPVETTTSTRKVLVDTLNARSGPSIDNEITGILVIDQVIEVEDNGEDWVHITTDEFTGYVNEKFLSEE